MYPSFNEEGERRAHDRVDHARRRRRTSEAISKGSKESSSRVFDGLQRIGFSLRDPFCFKSIERNEGTLR